MTDRVSGFHRGVATYYETSGGERVDIDPAVVETVLSLLGPPAVPSAAAVAQ